MYVLFKCSGVQKTYISASLLHFTDMKRTLILKSALEEGDRNTASEDGNSILDIKFDNYNGRGAQTIREDRTVRGR